MRYYSPADGPLVKLGRGCLLAAGSMLSAGVLAAALHSLGVF